MAQDKGEPVFRLRGPKQTRLEREIANFAAWERRIAGKRAKWEQRIAALEPTKKTTKKRST